MNEIVSLKDIVVDFDGERILDELSLDIHDKEFVTFLGPSGCGKTTTLRVIAGFITPKSGNVFFDGKDIASVPPYKRQVNTVFQKYALFPHLNVYENVAFGLRLKKLPEETIRPKVLEMLETVGLRGFERRSINQLSGGQQQRTALARILAYEPEILLLDEPFSAMDTYLREKLRLELAEALKDYDGVSILVTHDRDEAYQLCPEILLMDQGKVLARGKTRDIFAWPQTCKAARLTGCKNISRIRRMGERHICALDWGGLELMADRLVGEEITAVGIRAHDFEPLSRQKAAAYAYENCIPVEEPQVSEMPFEWYITLKNGLWWKREKTIHTHNSAGVIPEYLRVDPSAILLLKGEL